MYGDASELVADNFTLACVQPGTHLNPQGLDLVRDGTRASNCPSGTIKSGQETIARGIDLAPSEPLQRAADHRVVILEQIPPSAIPQRDSLLRSAHDIGEENRREHPVGLRAASHAGKEIFNFIGYGLRISEPRHVILSREFNQLGIGYVLRQVTTSCDRHSPVVQAVNYQGGNADSGKHVADIDLHIGSGQRRKFGRADAQSKESRPPVTEARIVSHAWRS